MYNDYRLPGVRQTPWACGPKGRVWYAAIKRDVKNKVVIANAKRIVDAMLPEQPATDWEYHYAFARREFLLNLLLAHYERHEAFPEGSICLVDRWMWRAFAYRHNGQLCRSLQWRGPSRDTFKTPGQWIKVPSLHSVLSAQEASHG